MRHVAAKSTANLGVKVMNFGAAISYEPQDAWTPLIRGSFMKRKVDRVTANH